MQLLDGHTAAVSALAFSADSYLLASGDRDGTAFVWDPAGGRVGLDADGLCNGLTFLPDGNLVVAGRSLKLWDARAGAAVRQLKYFLPTTPRTATGVVGFGPQSVGVGVGARGKPTPGFFALHDLPAETYRTPRFDEPAGVRAVAAHPPSQTVAWTNGSRRATAWTITRPDPVHFPLAHTSPAVAFHPDGTLLAVAQEWGVKLLDIPRKQERLAWKGHTGQVTAVAFTPDGRTLVTGSWDGTVKLWDSPTGGLRTTFSWPLGRVTAVAVAPDGARLAAGGDKGAVLVWDAD